MSQSEVAYNEALDFLYSFVDYSLKHSSELAKADFNLDRIRELMVELGNPHKKYPILHVAGTKGKGSVCALAASGLMAAGHHVGLYTSPHLLDYCERIQVDGEPIGHEELVRLVEAARPAIARIPRLTTFEITTALALLEFSDRQVDVAVLEVGLGGRLDATNVVLPQVAVITSLSYDHQAVLGNTLAQIAREKAGIIKERVPVVSAPQRDEALEVLVQVAHDRQAPFTLLGRDITFWPLSHSLDAQSLRVSQGDRDLDITIPLLGAHQIQNAATAVAALRLMNEAGTEIRDVDILKGFAEVKWPGRFQVARREPPVILDSAHNQDSFARLRQALDDYFPGRRGYLVFGASEDKNIPGMFEEIRGKIIEAIITKADHPRALEPDAIAALAAELGIPHRIMMPVRSAFVEALGRAEKDGSIVISAGSMFVTAEAMAAWNAY